MEAEQKLLRAIPKVDSLLEQVQNRPEMRDWPRAPLVEAVRTTLESLRRDILAGRVSRLPDSEALMDRVGRAARLELRPGLRKVVNATGVVIHTNLGRSILAPEVAARLTELAASYSTLEYDPAEGLRGSRQVHVEKLLIRLTGCEAALVVNNNAAAVLLILAALFRGRELIVSRGELVEIGGSFRIPAIMEEGGAILREVGTTNKTRLNDYARAIDPERTGGLLKVHSSNFRIIGYTESASVASLAALARERRLPLVVDLGSGTFFNLQPLGIHDEPTVGQMLEAGADLVSFSGDKMLGGAQAGLIVGRRDQVAQLRAHPLARALRVDKMTLAALEATLRLYLDPEEARRRIPTLAMLFIGSEELRAKAESLRAALSGRPGLGLELVPSENQVGGGSAPERPLPSWAVAVTVPGLSPDALEKALRLNEPPIVARIVKDRLFLEVRTIDPADFGAILDAFSSLPGPGSYS
ncbi:MAG: L-seryl-tRNA(Sec) selenium transferase [Candidatus Adiutrix sp.]|jgi:L-seryl-tRNA(Ser) seleniumtransferase|nr:L-seryl-tRNA(Sec) selenium transferase [Candidatus Adiutrix sp.]